MKVGSLFSGMLGLDLAVESATGASLAWACEIEPLPRRLIRARRPAARLFDDVRRLRPPPCDILTGGFPCTDLSVAGRQAGLAGERSGLWYEMRRVIAACRPRLVLVENVRNLRNLGLREVLADLQAIGYAAEWQTVQALAAGALHKRSRIFIVAYPDVDGAPLLFHDGLRDEYAAAFTRKRNGFWSRFPCAPVIGAADLPSDVRGARLTATGNAVCPMQAEPLARAMVGQGMPFGVQVEHVDHIASKLPFAGAARGGRIYVREAAVPEALAMQWHDAWIAANPDAARAVLPAARNTYPTPSAADYVSSQNGVNGVGGENERPSAGTPSLSTMARNGALWPTPQAHDKKADRSEASKADGGGQTLTGAARNLWPSPTASMQTPEDIGQAMYAGIDPGRPAYRNAAQGLWPTACTTDAARHTTDADGAMHPGTTLTDAVRLWATPAAANWRSGSVSDDCFDRNSRPLKEQVLRQDLGLYSTPTASDGDGGRANPASRQGGPALRDQMGVSQANGGRFLNPAWVSWLMGFPPGWFDGTSDHDAQIGLFT